MQTEWRVSWEMVTPFSRADLYTANEFIGPISALDELDWSPTENVTQDEEQARQQYLTLMGWEQAGSQPIRNVKLESREPRKWEIVRA